MTERPMEPAEALLRAAAWLKRLRRPGVAPRQHAEADEHLDQAPRPRRDLDGPSNGP